MQRYIVYGQDGVYLDFSGQQQSEPAPPDSIVPGVTAEIVYDQPSYTDLETTAGKDAVPIKALYFSSAAVTADSLNGAKAQMDSIGANALVLEMKNPDGVLSWNSTVQLAASYGTNGNADLSASLAALKEQGVYLVARISVCVDKYMALRNTPLGLATGEGRLYADEAGTWLDPSSSEVRQYTAELARALYALGFDEVMLANFAHPQIADTASLSYSQVSSVTLTPEIIMSGFALYMRDAAAEAGGRLSVLCDANSFRNDLEAKTGQNGELFGKVFDRFYWTTDGNALATDTELAARFIPSGELAARFVPIMFATGSSESWMYPYG